MTDLRRLKRTLMVATVCLLMLLSAARAVAPVRAQPLNRAAILVNYGDRTETYCVAFPEAQISGVELLRRAGLEVVGKTYPGVGEAVCRIQGLGCSYPAEECFCQCMGSPCIFWSYWYWGDNDWVYSGMGASSHKVGNGALEAWIWGDGQTKPPALAFDAICAAASPTPNDTATWTPTVQPTSAPSWTPVPPTAVPPSVDPYPGGATPKPAQTDAPADPYPVDVPTEEPTWTHVPTWTLQATARPGSTVTRTATYGPSATPRQVLEPLPAQTALPTHTLLDSLQQIVEPIASGTPTPPPLEQAAPVEQALAVPRSVEAPTEVDVAVVAALISTSVAESRVTPPAVSAPQAATRSYGAFVVLLLVLLALVCYAALVQRQRRRALDAHATRSQEDSR